MTKPWAVRGLTLLRSVSHLEASNSKRLNVSPGAQAWVGELREAGCILCGAALSVVLEDIVDTRFGTLGTYTICQCSRCGLEQIDPLPTSDELKKLYEVHYNFGGERGTAYTRLRGWFLSSRMYRLWLTLDGDIAFHTRKGTGRLLDIGCNEGRSLKIYARNGFQAEGLELNETAARVAREAGFTVYAIPLVDFEPAAPYDVVVLSNVLEHSLDPKRMLLDVARILKPNGQVWVSCPNSESWLRLLFGRSWINWHVPFHIVQFSRTSLQELLLKASFNHTEFRQVTPAAWVASSLIIRMFFREGSPTRQLRNPMLFPAVMLAVRAFLFPILSLANHLGKGDCLAAIATKAA